MSFEDARRIYREPKKPLNEPDSKKADIAFRALDISQTKAAGHEDVLDYLNHLGLMPTSHGHFIDREGYLLSFNHVKCMVKRDLGKQAVIKLEAISLAVRMVYVKNPPKQVTEIGTVRRLKEIKNDLKINT